MARLQFSLRLYYEITSPACDFIFNLEAAHTPQQSVVREKLTLSQDVPTQSYLDPVTRTRWLRLTGHNGPLTVDYEAVVDIEHYAVPPSQLGESWVADLPADVLPYLLPSRYCESDRLHGMAVRQFGHLPRGYTRVKAIRDWVATHVVFQSNTSTGTTSACDVLIERAGVCRDFAHLMIALCRAINVPARFVTGIDYGADPALGPTDFHAYVEAYIDDRWYLFDPSNTAIPMGFVRFATGRDASDCAFATMFGGVLPGSPIISIQAIPDDQGTLVMPHHTDLALSTCQDLVKA